jgi:hypothetical protein
LQLSVFGYLNVPPCLRVPSPPCGGELERGVGHERNLNIGQHPLEVLHNLNVLIAPNAKSLPLEQRSLF